MRVLRFIVVFILVAIIVTTAAVTAAFTLWSLLAANPGTATALLTLFVLAPGSGLVAGIIFAVRSVRRAGRADGPGQEAGGSGPNFTLALAAALTGLLAGYGGAQAWIDLAYLERWTNPAAAPFWLPYGPAFAGALLAIALAALVLADGRSGSPR